MESWIVHAERAGGVRRDGGGEGGGYIGTSKTREKRNSSRWEQGSLTFSSISEVAMKNLLMSLESLTPDLR